MTVCTKPLIFIEKIIMINKPESISLLLHEFTSNCFKCLKLNLQIFKRVGC